MKNLATFKIKKTLLSALVAILCIANLAAQVPSQFSYQAIVRNADGTVKANTSVTLKIDIIRKDQSLAFTETHSVTTNEYGLATIAVGSQLDGLDNIEWIDGPYFIAITLDGEAMGTNQLLTVPFSMFSNEARYAYGVPYDSIDNAPDLSVYATRNMDGEKIQNLADPFDGTDAANKQYVDNLRNDTDEKIAKLLELLLQVEGTSVRSLLDAGVNIQDIINVKGIDSLIAMGFTDSLNLNRMFDAGYLVGVILQAGADTADVAAASLIGTTPPDGDGNTYDWVKIGNQQWTSQNLRTTSYLDGTALADKTDYWEVDNDANNAEEYGRLYSYYVATGKATCPDGWHTAGKEDWNTLIDFLVNLYGTEAINKELFKDMDNGTGLSLVETGSVVAEEWGPGDASMWSLEPGNASSLTYLQIPHSDDSGLFTMTFDDSSEFFDLAKTIFDALRCVRNAD